jgi:hypothetical protein
MNADGSEQTNISGGRFGVDLTGVQVQIVSHKRPRCVRCGCLAKPAYTLHDSPFIELCRQCYFWGIEAAEAK